MCQWAKDTYRLWCLCFVCITNKYGYTQRECCEHDMRITGCEQYGSSRSSGDASSCNCDDMEWVNATHRSKCAPIFVFHFLIWYKNSEWDRSYLVRIARTRVCTRSHSFLVRVKWIWRRVVSDRWCKRAEWYKTIQWNFTIIFICAYCVLGAHVLPLLINPLHSICAKSCAEFIYSNESERIQISLGNDLISNSLAQRQSKQLIEWVIRVFGVRVLGLCWLGV